METDEYQCDPCLARSRSVQASFWCPFCSESFCKICCQFHQTMKLTRTHKVHRITEVTSSDKQRMRSQPHRSGLEDLTISLFNEKTQLREIDNVLLHLDNLCDTSLTLKKMNFDMKMKNEARKNDTLRKVQIFKTRLKELADEFERHITGELEYLQHAESLQIEARIEECESIFNTIELSKDITQAIKVEYITPQTIHKINAARQRCNEFKNSLQRIHSKMDLVQYNLAIDRNVSDAINTSPAIIGKIEVTRDSVEDETNKQESPAAPVQRRNSRQDTNVVDTSRSENKAHVGSVYAQKLHEIYLQRKDDQDETMITSICPMDTNNFITLDRNNNKLLLVRSDGTVITQYVLTNQIWDMTLIDQSSAGVTVPDNDKIVVVRIRDNNLCAEKLVKTSNICHGICAIDGFLAVTVKGGYVKIITKAGEEVASIRHNDRGEILFKDPQHVATNRDQTELYVTDNALHTVTALCLTGVKIDTQPKFIFRDNELRNPAGLCLDRRGNIYVCGFSSHNIIQLSPDGKLLQVLLSGVINPQTVALTTMEDRLMVSSLFSGNRQKTMRNVIEVFQMF